MLSRKTGGGKLQSESMAPRHGFEPRFTAPKAAVLPLDDRGMQRWKTVQFQCRRGSSYPQPGERCGGFTGPSMLRILGLALQLVGDRVHMHLEVTRVGSHRTETLPPTESTAAQRAAKPPSDSHLSCLSRFGNRLKRLFRSNSHGSKRFAIPDWAHGWRIRGDVRFGRAGRGRGGRAGSGRLQDGRPVSSLS
jgi:hypothetical protein